MRISIFKIAGAVSLLAAISGCAVEQHSTQLSPLQVNAKSSMARLSQKTEIHLNTGYSRTLKSDSMWVDIGSVKEGEVFKPYHDVFTLEGANVYEAYLVVANNTLTGFYLPVQHSFSPLSPQVSLSFIKQE